MSSEGSGATRGGGDGTHNEDAFVVNEGLGLYVVCDGDSSRPAGEIAARLAAESVEQTIEAAHGAPESNLAEVADDVVEGALRAALDAVDRAGHEDPDIAGLFTTITILLVHGGFSVIGHRGDSRAYLIRRGRVSQLTRDHDVTTPLGDRSDGGGGFDVFASRLEAGDTVVLCSDGAAGAVKDPGIVRMAGTLSPHMLASRIVAEAHKRSPDEDSTVVIVRVRGAREPGWLELSRSPRPTRFGHLIEAWPSPAEESRRRSVRASRSDDAG